MKECGILKVLIKMVNRDDINLSNEAIELILYITSTNNLSIYHLRQIVVKVLLTWKTSCFD